MVVGPWKGFIVNTLQLVRSPQSRIPYGITKMGTTHGVVEQ
jgi:hypothetical protein